MAASVRFNDHLKTAILLNTRGTREAISLALEMKNLLVFVYVSTAYSHYDKKNKIIEECIYPPKADWRTCIKIAEETDEYVLNTFMLKYIDELPNTYTFTKALSENLVHDMCTGRIPAIILRPSVVISTLEEPVVGWCDNFNGPSGISVAGGLGLLRIMYASDDTPLDLIPIDVAIKGLIVASCHRATMQGQQKYKEVCVYNGCGAEMYSMSVPLLVREGKHIVKKFPMKNQVWHPSFSTTSYKGWYYINVILLQVLPAVIVDFVLIATRNKPRLLKLQRKIYTAMEVLQFFMTNSSSFNNDKFLALNKFLREEDRREFLFERKNINKKQIIWDNFIKGRIYLFNDHSSTCEKSRRIKLMKIIHYSIIFIFYVLLFRVFYTKFLRVYFGD